MSETLRTLDSSLRHDPMKLETFTPRGKDGEEDFTSELDKLAQRTKQTTQLKVDLTNLGPATQGLVDDAAGGLAGKLLREARQLIKLEKYADALTPLTRLLEDDRTHIEGMYLTGLCHYKLEKPETAMQDLKPLRGMRLTDDISTRVAALRAEIRGQLLPRVLVENLILIRLGRIDQAILHIRAAVDLDPESSICHYLLAGTLMLAGRLDESLTAVEAGLKAKTDDPQLLQRFHAQIERRYTREKMRDVRGMFWRGKYGRARRTLARLDDRTRGTPLWVMLDDYFAKLDGGGGFLGLFGTAKDPAKIPPDGSFEEVDALYVFLASEHTDLAQKSLGQAHCEEAAVQMRTVLAKLPKFAYAHYLLAVSLYGGIVVRLANGKLPAIEEVDRDLDSARRHAAAAAADPTIKDVKDLQRTIASGIQQMSEVRKELAIRKREADAINAAIEKYKSVMDAVGKGISGVAHFRKIEGLLQGLRNDLPKVQASLHSAEGRQAFEQLKSAVDRHWNDLTRMETQIQEAELVEPLLNRFNAIMTEVKDGGGIRSRAQAMNMLARFRSLKEDTASALLRAHSPDARKVLLDLSNAVARILDQLGG